MTRTVSKDIVDRAYDVMSAELDHWQIVGPQFDGKREFFTAVRRNDPPQVFAENAIAASANDSAQAPVTFQHLINRQYAIACVQWHGLEAVLKDQMIQDAIGG